MHTHSGHTIPDPPSDLEERRQWKTIYFTSLYGSSKEEMARYIDHVVETNRKRRMRRVYAIGLTGFFGGLCTSQGAVHGWWRLTVLGVLLMCISFGIIIDGPRATRRMQREGHAIVGAAVIARLFRMFR